ncbi:hypothetical protein ACIQF6_33300 [Kitasatospora sp. NPDC092948]|uniref:hypothetical protein n=1 Tax=Kitasatospora sp. NPDC092948 TaxID=3364088 RepID=UPI00380D3906
MSNKPHPTPNRSSSEKADRTGLRTTPPRDADSPVGRRTPRRLPRTLTVVLPLVLAAAGLGAMFASLVGIPKIREQLHSPERSMTITECHIIRQARTRTAECTGTGQSGDSGVTADALRIDNAPNYAPGTVVKVHCTSDGACAAFPVYRLAFLAFPVAAVAMITISLGIVAFQLADLAASHRMTSLHLHRFAVRLGLALAVLLPLTLAGSLTYVLT